jgi:hypothetical protein
MRFTSLVACVPSWACHECTEKNSMRIKYVGERSRLTAHAVVFRREEAPLYLTASVGPLVDRSVRWSVPTMQLCGKLVTSRLLREEEEEEENWLCRYSFTPRD